GESCQDIRPGVGDRASLSVHRHGRPGDLSAEGLADRLVAQADAKDGNSARGSPDQIKADAGLVRRAGTRRQHDGLRPTVQGFADGQPVVAPHLALGANITQEVIQIERKTIVVVDQEDHWGNTIKMNLGTDWARILAPAHPGGQRWTTSAPAQSQSSPRSHWCPFAGPMGTEWALRGGALDDPERHLHPLMSHGGS